jgi:hypothetical protein
VGIIPLADEKLVQPGEYSLPEPVWLKIDIKKSVYHADPFGFVKDGNYHILCEEYDYTTAKGFLASFKVDCQTFRISSKTIALEKKYHLAFPYLFEYQHIWFCIPENSAGGNVDLYRLDLPSGKLVFEQILIPNLEAVDASLFFHNGFWWLFFTDKIATNERLNIFYADKFKGPYLPHVNNPVKVDVRSTRPAGKPFILDGKLLRPAQDCSLRSGRRICINHISKLSPTEFEESEFAILNPSTTSRYPDGMHTFCIADGAVIVDGKEEMFVWQAFVRKLRTKIHNI